MGDIKVSEAFIDVVYITNVSGTAQTGLSPTCTSVKVEDNTRTSETVSELGSGWYQATVTPDAAGTWLTEWAVSGTYTIQYPFKMFKVGGGRTEDINTAVTALNDLAVTDVLADSTAFNGADVASIKSTVEAINTALTFQYQEPATISQDSPTTEQEYPVLTTTANVRIIGLAAKCTWSSQPTPLNLIVTIDGRTLTFYRNTPVSNTWYYPGMAESDVETALPMGTTSQMQSRTFLLEGRSIAVTAKVTGGTVSNLSARVIYAKR